MPISQQIRRDIFDAIILSGSNWSGALADPDFLGRIFDLSKMPSSDSRFSDAAGDIWQHRVNNWDWEDDWIFSDGRFNLLNCDDDFFLRFLCETVHPVVRPDEQQALRLVQSYNDLLRPSGYEIVERGSIAGRSVYAARRLFTASPPSLKLVKQDPIFDEGYLAQQITRIESSIEYDPDLAIGTSKELVESCCKTILRLREKEIDSNWDLPQLVKATYKELKLTPDDIPDSAKASKAIKRLLSNLATVTDGIAELRNKYGSGHGKDALNKGLSARHARLAVGSATTLVIFLFETHRYRES